MKFLDRLIKGVNPDEDPLDNDIFEEDEIYGNSRDNNFGNSGDISDFMNSGGGYSPYSNQNQGGMMQNQQNPQQSYQPSPQSISSVGGGGLSVGSGNMQYSVEIIAVRPEEYNKVEEIADLLVNKKTVILNLEETSKETARRLIDFLRGVAYAIQGQVERVGDKIFVITPSNIPIEASQIKEARRKNTNTDNSIY